MMTRTLAALATALTIAGLPAMAANITAADPKAIADSLTAGGYRAELTKDQAGDPVINSAAAGAPFSIFFYGCTNGAACTSLAFQTAFDLPKGTTPAAINKWNSKNRFAKAYLDDENDPFLEMDINLEGGGISGDLFKANVAIWESASGAFQTHVGF